MSDSVSPWTAAFQALSFTNSQSLLKLMSIKPVMSSNHLILYKPHDFFSINSTSLSLNMSVSTKFKIKVVFQRTWDVSFLISTFITSL